MFAADIVRLQRQGRWNEAEQECRRRLAEQPRDDVALHQLGGVVLRLGRVDEALDLLRGAAELSPANPYHRIDLAAVLGKIGRPTDALPHLAMALRLKPDIPELHNNLGVTLEKLDQFDQAAAAYREAARLRPDYPEAHHNLGNLLRKVGRPAESAAEYRDAVRLNGQYGKAVQGLAGTLADLGEIEETIRTLQCLVEHMPTLAAARSALLYTIHYSPEYDAPRLAGEHREWGRVFCEPVRRAIAPHENDRTPERKLRVGYVSPDFREHTVPHFVTAALEHHNRENFEVFCYSDVEKPDDITASLKGMAEHWAETRGMRDEALAGRIRQDRIDILIDLRGHAANNRLPMFCLKPAPIQANMVGYFDTTGLSTMDYRITDEHMDPAGKGGWKRGRSSFFPDQYHTEKLVRLAGSCWCYTADEDAPEVAEPPVLRNGFITFGSLNKIVKVSEPCARLWAAVLEAVPGAKLLLSVASADAAGTVRKRLESYDLPLERLIITDKTRIRREYLHRFNEIDIALDTWPFNGITTTCDGVWMGVPCVSMTGNTSVSQAGKSILHAADLGELATESPERFVTVASELARDVARLTDLRRTMRDRLLASPLMDHRGFARKLEAAYREMWRAWCAVG
jgi:protein O-GlcNAc transferase